MGTLPILCMYVWSKREALGWWRRQRQWTASLLEQRRRTLDGVGACGMAVLDVELPE